MVHHLEAHSDRYITDFPILTGRRMWGCGGSTLHCRLKLHNSWIVVLGNLKSILTCTAFTRS
jgi:hypothetical protein